MHELSDIRYQIPDVRSHELVSESENKLLAAIVAWFVTYPPFDAMGLEDIAYFVRHADLTYHPHGSQIIAPASGIPGFLYIVKRGAVRVRKPFALTGGGADFLVLGPGECFSISGLMEKRAVTGTYVAAADTF